VRQLFISRQPNVKDLEWARDAAMRAVQAAPDLSEPRVALALTRLHAGDVVGGVVALREAIARSPSNGEAIGWLGEILLEIGRTDEAVRRLELALSLDDSLNTPRWALARYRAYQGDFAGAMEAMDIVSQRTGDPRFATVKARLLLWNRDLEGVQRFGEQIQAQSGDDTFLTLYPIKAILGEEPVELALERVERLLQQPGASHRMLTVARQSMAEICAFLDRTDLALGLISRATDLGLTDLLWADRCPLLASTRLRPEWPLLRERIAAHAEAVIDAVW
jgi:tetratricopeptide (TPR) repeat protein